VPRLLSDAVVRPPCLQTSDLLLQPHAPVQSFEQVKLAQLSACGVGAGVAPVPAHVPRFTSDAVVRPPVLHTLPVRLHPHAPLQLLLHRMLAQFTSPAQAPRLASLAVVRPPTMQALDLRLHPHPNRQSLLHRMLGHDVGATVGLADGAAVVGAAEGGRVMRAPAHVSHLTGHQNCAPAVAQSKLSRSQNVGSSAPLQPKWPVVTVIVVAVDVAVCVEAVAVVSVVVSGQLLHLAGHVVARPAVTPQTKVGFSHMPAGSRTPAQLCKGSGGDVGAVLGAAVHVPHRPGHTAANPAVVAQLDPRVWS
jgi:hypothetical protein